jgi:hypothetical protein
MVESRRNFMSGESWLQKVRLSERPQPAKREVLRLPRFIENDRECIDGDDCRPAKEGGSKKM